MDGGREGWTLEGGGKEVGRGRGRNGGGEGNDGGKERRTDGGKEIEKQ